MLRWGHSVVRMYDLLRSSYGVHRPVVYVYKLLVLAVRAYLFTHLMSYVLLSLKFNN